MGRLAILGYVPVLVALAVIAIAGQPGLDASRSLPMPRFDAGRALDDLAKLDALGRGGGGREVGTQGHAEVVRFVAKEFERAGLSCRIDRFSDHLGGEMVNVVAELPGSGDEVIILGAHHDATGSGPAVVDGLAGLAVLLESARALKESRLAEASSIAQPASLRGPIEPIAGERTILFVSWDGDSMGCAGSAHFVDRYQPWATRRVRAVISLDSVGWKDGLPVVHSPLYHDRFGGAHGAPDWLVWKVVESARHAGVHTAMGDRFLSVAYQVALRMIDLGYYSDDRSFLLEGIPGVFVSDFSLTRFYPYYGSREDTFDQIGLGSLEKAGRLVTSAVHELAEAEQLPVGERQFLLLPSPFGWLRLTADQIRLLGALALLPGILALAGRGRGWLLPGLFAGMSAAYLFGLFGVDEVVFSALAGPVVLAVPLLALSTRRGIYGFLATIVPLATLVLLLVSLAASSYDRQTIFPREGFAALLACAGFAAALAVGRALAAPPVPSPASGTVLVPLTPA